MKLSTLIISLLIMGSVYCFGQTKAILFNPDFKLASLKESDSYMANPENLIFNESASIEAQEDITIKDYWMLSLGTIADKKNFTGEILLKKGAIYDRFGIINFNLGTEFALRKDNFYIAPKVGFEMDMIIFSSRLSIVNYTNFKRVEPNLTPEIGFSFIGFINFTYGYNISLVPKRIEYVPAHHLSFWVNIPIKLLE